MANPFLFDSAPTGANENPFLMEASQVPQVPQVPMQQGVIPNAVPVPAAAPVPVANPFLAGTGMMPQVQPQIQQPYYAPQIQQPQIAPAAQANPFADFGSGGVTAAPVQPPTQAKANPFADFADVPSPQPQSSSNAQALFGVPDEPVNQAQKLEDIPKETKVEESPQVENKVPEPVQETVVDPPIVPLETEVAPIIEPSTQGSELFKSPTDGENVVQEKLEEEEPLPPPPAELKNDSPLPPPPANEEIKEVENVASPIIDVKPEPIDEGQKESQDLPEPPKEMIEVEEEIQKNEELNEPPKIETEEEVVEEKTEEISEVKELEPPGPSTGASLFNLEAEPDLEAKVEEEVTSPVKMSTGDAIFSDIPNTDVTSTGASIFGLSDEGAANTTGASLFGVTAPRAAQPTLGSMSGWDENFDRKFESATDSSGGPVSYIPGDPFDPFAGTGAGLLPTSAQSGFDDNSFGQASFNPTAPQNTPGIGRKSGAPPTNFGDVNNPFLDTGNFVAGDNKEGDEDADSPLFDDDTSKPLEAFPRLVCDVPGWEMFIRHPPKKKLTAQRFWKKIYVRLVMQGDNPCVQLFENKDAKDAFQELPLQAAYSLSDISHQVFDQYTKIFTIKLQYIFYKERAGIRPGQISKMQKLTDKIGFLAKAVEDADYQGVKEFASDMKKLGVPLEHAPQISELLKLGSDNYEDLKQFTICIEEKLFKMDAHRDRALTYKTEEVQLTAVDEVFVEQDKSGNVLKQLCRVRVFFLSFLTGMPEVELGVNDIARMGLEVVGRHDILPVPTEQWIRYEDIEFHSIVDKKEFNKNDHIIKFQPPDACYLEIMRFRVRPPRNRELPMQARCQFIISGNKVEIRADMMIPYPHTKAWGQVPCEDVAMRIPLPECWIYQFRTEKHHVSLSQLAIGNLNIGTRMGSVKSAHRRAGKVKGLERFMGALETQTQELMETSSGQAKYEHQHKAIVWRVSRLPKHGQGSYTNHEFVCKLRLTSYDQMPESFEKHFYVEFTQPATAISNTVLRSVSIQNGSGDPPEKFVKYLARHEYKLEIDFAEKEQNTYIAVTRDRPKVEPEPEPEMKEYPDFPDENGAKRFSESDSD